MRGFIGGIVWGTGVAVLGLAGLAVLNPPPAPAPVVESETPTSQPEAPVEGNSPTVATGENDTVRPDPAPVNPPGIADQDDVARVDPEPTQEPSVSEQPDAPDAPADSEAETVEAPLAEDAPAATPLWQPEELAEPDDAGEESDAVSTDIARRPEVESGTPETPSVAEAEISEADPIAPEQPVETPESLPQPETPLTTDTAPAASPTAERPEPQVTENELLQPETSVDESPEIDSSQDVAPEGVGAIASLPEPAPDQTPTTDETSSDALTTLSDTQNETPNVLTSNDSPVVPLERPPLPVIETPSTEPVDEVAEAQPSDDTPETSEEAALSPRIGERIAPLTERRSAGSLVDRVGQADPMTAEMGRPLDLYSEAAEIEEDKPLMAIVLIDDAQSVGVEALQDFPYPLTFAIDPTSPGAVEKMLRHRAAGFEVVAMVDLPSAATARDAEVMLSASFDRLDQTVALLEGTGEGVQGNRPLSSQVTDFIATTGRGLITQGNGFNTMQKLALRDGVPALPVFRDFDNSGQTPTVMRRFLDQAAFRARQEGGVIMLGRVRPDTISALLIWALQDRASSVSLVPVSAVLKAATQTTQ